MQFDIHHTVLNLSDLVNQVMSGNEIILEDRGKPVARIIPVPCLKYTTFQFGIIPDLKIKDDFDAPLPPDIWDN